MPKIVLNHVTKKFDRNSIAVQDLNLEIPQGEFLTIMGPSGCGKTTLLRLIAGLEKPTSGEILFDGISVRSIAPINRGISMVFQDYALYNHMTVKKNLSFGLKEKGIKKIEIEYRIQETAEMLGITTLLNRKPNALSGGQKQRVAIGRALVRKPDIIIFDEPFSNLDNVLCRTLQKELIQLHESLESTFIYVTHNKADAFAMGTKIAIMDEGKIVQIGTADSFRTHPVNTFVANMVAESKLNFLSMDFLPEQYRMDVKNAIVSIPPDAFYTEPVPSNIDCYLPVTLIHSDRLGSTTELLCLLEDGQQIHCTLKDDHIFPHNQTFKLYFSPQDIHIFDATTTLCIL